MRNRDDARQSAATPAGFRAGELLGISVVVAAALFIFRGTPFGFFAQDDFAWLWFSRYPDFGKYLQVFLRFNGAGFYRPLSQETLFCVGQKIFGLNPLGFHLISLGLHLLSSICLYFVLRSFFGRLPCVFGTLFFAVHSTHLSSVQWVSAAPEPMAAAFIFASLFFFIRFHSSGRFWLWSLSFALMALGVMSKESILTLPLVLAVFCLLWAPRRLAWVAPHFALAGLYGVLRLTSRIAVSPYRLTFGWEVWHNLERYLNWTGYFSDVFLVSKLKWNPGGGQALIAGAVLSALVGMWFYSTNRKVAVFSLAWYFLALQPVLYFSGHIYPYYLSPSLAAVSLLIASVIPSNAPWKTWTSGILLAAFCLWASEASVKREGRWWNERTFVARDILASMPQLDSQMPRGDSAFLFGFTPTELGMMLQEMALKDYGYAPPRFVLAGPHTALTTTYFRNEAFERVHCLMYSQGRLFDLTDEFRRGIDFVAESSVRLEPSSSALDAGRDSLSFQLNNMDVESVDILYTRDGVLQPVIRNLRIDALHRIEAAANFVPRGTYRYCALRDSRPGKLSPWFMVNQVVVVR
jgi:hypothetical protein